MMDTISASIRASADKAFIEQFGVSEEVANSELISEDWGDDYGCYRIGLHTKRYTPSSIAKLEERFNAVGIAQEMPKFPANKIAMPELPKLNRLSVSQTARFAINAVNPTLEHIDLLDCGSYRTYFFKYHAPSDQSRCVINGYEYKLDLIIRDGKIFLFLTDPDDVNENIDLDDTEAYWMVSESAVKALGAYEKEKHADFVLIAQEWGESEVLFWLPRTTFYQRYRAIENKKQIQQVVNKLFDLEYRLKSAETAYASKVQNEQLKRLGIPYRTAYKMVTSGLLEGSWGTGERSNTVIHFVFNDAHGKHSKGDFLCTNPKSGYLPEFMAYELVVDGVVMAEVPYAVTCKSCLKKLETMLKKLEK